MPATPISPMTPPVAPARADAPAPVAPPEPTAAPSAQPHPAELLQDAKTIAVVGFSTNPGKAAHGAPMELVRRGWNVIPVHPSASEVAGLKAYRTLSEIPGQVDLVDVFRPANEAPALASEAAKLGVKTLWLQKGITSPEARQIATEAGMNYVEDICAGATSAQFDVRPRA